MICSKLTMTKNDTTIINEGMQKSKADIGWRQLGVHTWIKIFVIAALLVSIFHIEIYQIVYRWMTDGSWSHGWLIPIFSLYFLNQRKQQLLSLESRPSYLGLFLMISCIVMYLLLIFQFKIGYFQSLMIIATTASVVLFLGGWKIIKYTWLPIGFLFFAVPLPGRYYRELTTPMRVLAAEIAGELLNVVDGLNASVNGVVIDVVWKGEHLQPALNVAEACSGMRLLMTFVALGVAMAYLHYRPAWQRMVLLCATIPIAILCNVVRVTSTGFIFVFIDPKYTQGAYHDGLGFLMLPMAFGIYWLLAVFMESLFTEEEALSVEDDLVIRRHVQS